MGKLAAVASVLSLALGLHFAVDAGRSVGTGAKNAGLEEINYLTSLMELFQTTVDDHQILLQGVQETALLGLISDQINKNSKPRGWKAIRQYSIRELEQSDYFGVQLMVDSLSSGLECLELEIAADFIQMTVSILKWESHDVAVCVPRTRRRDVGINNGSKGGWGMWKLVRIITWI